MQKTINYTASVSKDSFKHPMTEEMSKRVARTINRKDTSQKVAVDLTTSWVARAPGRLEAFRALLGGAAAAAGESMTVDFQINGVSALTAVITLNNTTTRDKWSVAVINYSKAEFAMGDLLEIVRDYTAGGGPTPMTNTLVEADLAYNG